MKKFFGKCLKNVKSAFSNVKNIAAAGVAAVTGSVIASAPAQAAIDLTGVTVDTTDYITIATFLVTALVAFWGIKKGLRLLG